MQSSTNIRRGNLKRTILIVVLVIILILIGVWIWWNSNKTRIVGEKIQKAVEEKSNGLYAVQYDDLSLDEFKGVLAIKNMHLTHDTARYRSIVAEGKAPSMLVDLFIPQLYAEGVKTPKALTSKEFIGRKLLITEPVIRLNYTNEGEYASRNLPTKELYQQLLGDLKLIKLDTLQIVNARIITHSKGKRDSVVFAHSNLAFYDIAVDSLSSQDSGRIFFAKNIGFDCADIITHDPTGRYDYKIRGLNVQSASNTFDIDHIDIVPFQGESAFVHAVPYQTDRIEAHFAGIHFSNASFATLMKENIIADNMQVNGLQLKIYRDLRIPRDNKNRSGTYPHQIVTDLPLPFYVKHANFPNANIQYRETSDLSGQTGTVVFNNCNITISNLTNIPYQLRKDNNCHIEVRGSLLGMTPMNASLNLSLGDQAGRFTIKGNTGGVDATKLNTLTEPMGLARIRRGNVKSLDFDMKGDNNHAVATVKVLYDDLKIDFLELDDDFKSGIDKKDVSSFIGNLFIKDNNPSGNNAPRIETVDHARDMNRSFFNLVWKTIFEGVNLTIGNKKKMKRP